MLFSMTGYGRAQQTIGERDIIVEIKSVNHRYFEFSAKTPRSYGYLEDKMKSFLQSKLSRGKVEVGVSIYTVGAGDTKVLINEEIVREYVEALRSLPSDLMLNDNLSLSSVARLPDAFSITKPEEDQEEVTNAVLSVLAEALEHFVSMREAEGKRMEADLLSRIAFIEQRVSMVEEQSPKTVEAYRERLTAKIEETLKNYDVDEQRVLTEVAIFADKVAVAEETIRLRSHIAQFRALVASGEPVGRKLDFLVQEFNREVNTIGSKCQDLSVTNIVVDMKAEIEKIREQIQNIE